MFGVRRAPDELRPSRADARSDGLAGEDDRKRAFRRVARPRRQVGAVFGLFRALLARRAGEKGRRRGAGTLGRRPSWTGRNRPPDGFDESRPALSAHRRRRAGRSAILRKNASFSSAGRITTRTRRFSAFSRMFSGSWRGARTPCCVWIKKRFPRAAPATVGRRERPDAASMSPQRSGSEIRRLFAAICSAKRTAP